MGEEYSKEFEKRTHEYCDNYVGEKVLSTAFNNLWRQSVQEISPQNLVTLTSGITNDLIKKGILIEVKKKSNPNNPVYNFYPTFEILPHEMLIKNNKVKKSDIEIALLLANHIENPCGVEVNGKIENLRSFYIREVRENILPKLINPFAKEYLEEIISKYEDK